MQDGNRSARARQASSLPGEMFIRVLEFLDRTGWRANTLREI